jgi:hypothetical protein
MSNTYRLGCLRLSLACRPRVTWGVALIFQRWEVISVLGPFTVILNRTGERA